MTLTDSAIPQHVFVGPHQGKQKIVCLFCWGAVPAPVNPFQFCNTMDTFIEAHSGCRETEKGASDE